MVTLYIKSRKPIYGKGINDADYVTQPLHGERCKFFDVWHSMIRRCYSINSLKTNPSYKGCTVSDEFMLFSNFKSWMMKQDYMNNALDKDILFHNNRIYSSHTCVFVPRYVNQFFSNLNRFKESSYPIGVNIKQGGHRKTIIYAAQGVSGYNSRHLGVAYTPLDAHRLWQSYKVKSCILLLEKYKSEPYNDERVINRIIEVQEVILKDLSENLETIFFNKSYTLGD